MSSVDALKSFAGWLWGCTHRRTTLPMTRNAQTYVVCLACGGELAYDWARMHRARKNLSAGNTPAGPHLPDTRAPEGIQLSERNT